MIKKNLSKIEISKNLSNSKGYSLLFSKKIVDDLINVLVEIIKEKNLIIKNIGNFKLIQKKERIGRNPKTMEKFMISKRKIISFKPSKNLLKNLNF
tara:strand:+ start:20 stop:307 length:288 start_codon:yes stop_codon:yes gene_type:complete